LFAGIVISATHHFFPLFLYHASLGISFKTAAAALIWLQNQQQNLYVAGPAIPRLPIWWNGKAVNIEIWL